MSTSGRHRVAGLTYKVRLPPLLGCQTPFVQIMDRIRIFLGASGEERKGQIRGCAVNVALWLTWASPLSFNKHHVSRRPSQQRLLCLPNIRTTNPRPHQSHLISAFPLLWFSSSLQGVSPRFSGDMSLKRSAPDGDSDPGLDEAARYRSDEDGQGGGGEGQGISSGPSEQGKEDALSSACPTGVCRQCRDAKVSGALRPSCKFCLFPVVAAVVSPLLQMSYD